MIHPDVQAALVEILESLLGKEHVYSHLEAGFEDNLPAVLVTVTQNDDGYMATHKAAFEFWSANLADARTLARTLIAHLTSQHHGTAAGLLDAVRVDIGLKQVPYANPDVVMLNATLEVDTRAI